MAIIEEIHEQVSQTNTHTEEPAKDVTTEGETDQDGDVFYDSTDYQIEELKQLLNEASEYKAKGNALFAQSEYQKAIAEYENALMVCPESQRKERSIYFSNIAACHLKLDQYKEARDMCTRSLELDSTYSKALLRRAQANERIGTSSAMSSALDDYKQLQKQAQDAYTLKECKRAQQELPGKIKIKMEQEKEEMIGKLKDLGNTLLGKFGLSTDNFQFTPDPNGSGSYSMNFVNK
ncbi:hypothetical protein EDC96DRAFT_260232 [Choanephora cucurbitarum]|nr:hypothetical protein EDC96DRAFT_260232 [Choanephora cucurbitarum]